VVTPRYRAVVFDLFGTLVHFRGRPDPRFEWLREPFAAVTDPRRSTTPRGAARGLDGHHRRPRAGHRRGASRDSLRPRPVRIGADASAAEALSTAHMGHLAGFTNLPDGHLDVVATLADRYRVGLVSNFDHAPTARAVLARHGLDRHLAATVISAEFGWRKPHPGIFRAALARLDVVPSEALYVGDTHLDHVIGALGVGMDVAWLAPSGGAAPDPPPTFRIASLAELPALLGR
jgi:HAD superfamily hydrolase (TIGR01549 family)